MKYYSEKLNELFNSPEELEAAEKTVTSKKAKKKTVETAEQPKAPSRKELAAAVEAADELVKKCYADYDQAQLKVEELSKSYLAEIDKILGDAKKAVKDAERARYDAIRKFNDTYGAYQVTYTGDKAADELLKAIRSINSTAHNIFRDSFWF